jgi:hypothetical protein
MIINYCAVKNSARNHFLSQIVRKLVFCILCIFPFNIGFSQDNTKPTEMYFTDDSPSIKKGQTLTLFTTDEVRPGVYIKYHNKEIYYIDRPIIVEFQVVNNRIDPFLFITSFNKAFTFDFEILTSTNRLIEHSHNYTIRTTQFEPILNDEIILKNNEVYGVRIDVSSWFDLRESGEYIIRGVFYPNLKTGALDDTRIYSENELYLNLNPPMTEKLQRIMEVEEIRRLKAESLPPYEVIDFLIRALQERDFERYFLYINFERFIQQFNNSRTLYLDAVDRNKPNIIEEFKGYLMGLNNLEDVPFSETIPADYEIERTVIEKRDAIVTVVEIFKYLNLVERKRYTYKLHLYDDKWLMDNYSVVNIGR